MYCSASKLCFCFFSLAGPLIGKASLRFYIPKMTLSDRINKRWCSDKPGRCTELTKEEEDSLAYYINYMASINHPFICKAVKALGTWSSKAFDLIGLTRRLAQVIPCTRSLRRDMT